MAKISEAAKRKARELLESEYGIRPSIDWPHASGPVAEQALARVLQEHSDVAKAYFCTGGATAENLRRAQALILPDEPCKHLWFSRSDPRNRARLTCQDCGKNLKLVEVGDE
jgi:hypothetical protein